MAKPAQSRAKVAYAMLQLYWKQGLPGICRQAMLTGNADSSQEADKMDLSVATPLYPSVSTWALLRYLRLRNVGENYFDLFLNLSKIRLPYQALKCGAGANGLIG